MLIDKWCLILLSSELLNEKNLTGLSFTNVDKHIFLSFEMYCIQNISRLSWHSSWLFHMIYIAWLFLILYFHYFQACMSKCFYKYAVNKDLKTNDMSTDNTWFILNLNGVSDSKPLRYCTKFKVPSVWNFRWTKFYLNNLPFSLAFQFIE